MEHAIKALKVLARVAMLALAAGCIYLIADSVDKMTPGLHTQGFAWIMVAGGILLWMLFGYAWPQVREPLPFILIFICVAILVGKRISHNAEEREMYQRIYHSMQK